MCWGTLRFADVQFEHDFLSEGIDVEQRPAGRRLASAAKSSDRWQSAVTSDLAGMFSESSAKYASCSKQIDAANLFDIRSVRRGGRIRHVRQ